MDLRGNSGGTPEPMFAALEPFFGPDAPPNVMRAILRQVGIAAPGNLRTLMRLPVARVALAFRQRPRVRFFGQPTAGVATSRRMVLLPDGAAVAIASSLMDTTRARENSHSIAPDFVIADDGG